MIVRYPPVINASRQTEVCMCPFLVVYATRESLGLFLRADIEHLNIDLLESAIDHHIILTLSLKNTLVQIDVLYTHSFTINCHIPWNSLCRIVYHILLINQTTHLESESHELCDEMTVVFVLEDRSGNFLLKLRKDEREGNLLLSTSCL